MRIMIFDVPAETGGALSVLYDFYNKYKLDQENEYIFVVSLPELQETSNITVLRYPWIKKSWVHRLYFDSFIAPKLINKYNVDKVLSLQNIVIPHSKVYQSIFVHNALPFTEHKFSFKEDRMLWFYQRVIGKRIISSIKEADQVIVQTSWMEEAIFKKTGVKEKEIVVLPPKVDIKVNKFYNKCRTEETIFFYPANGMKFKNHRVIIDACIILKEQNVNNYSVVLTVRKNENKEMVTLGEKIKKFDLPIIFKGQLKKEEVFKYYEKSVLLFTSYVETVGLPLIEAKLHKAPIIAANCKYSNEILNDYDSVEYFCYSDSRALAQVMKKFI